MRGFTLLELLVVISIIGLLVSMLTPNYSRVREIARRTYCAANLAGIGKAWHMYFQDSNYRLPYMTNPSTFEDTPSYYNYLLYRTTSQITPPQTTPMQVGDYVNAGVLIKGKQIGHEKIFVCPTVEKNIPSHRWFSDNAGGFVNTPNPTPPALNPSYVSRMTYGMRRAKPYTDRKLANLPATDARNRDLMLSMSNLENVGTPASDFSLMADSFQPPDPAHGAPLPAALLSHTPGVNVLFLDGHVSFFSDSSGKVLCDNGVLDWDPSGKYNFEHDQVWVRIDQGH